MVEKNLVLFDFDGTITSKDSLIEFIIYYRGKFSLLFGLLLFLPVIILMKLKLISNHSVKQLFLSYFFKGESKDVFDNKCLVFSQKILPKIIPESSIEKIKQHMNDKKYIVSASPEIYIRPWADNMNCNVIGTRLEVNNGRLTGKISGLNCNGKEKARRIREEIDLDNFTIIYAYGNSAGDKEMLQLADLSYYGQL